MNEQISEEFARELFDEYKNYNLSSYNEGFINYIKNKGYIKLSREEEIKDNIRDYMESIDYTEKTSSNTKFMIRDLLELIKILENKLKQLNNKNKGD